MCEKCLLQFGGLIEPKRLLSGNTRYFVDAKKPLIAEIIPREQEKGNETKTSSD